MPATWKTVCVFISSTFRDMHAERHWLVKRVFPQLRESLLKDRIHLEDIDLRWGVTGEQSDNDQALDVCVGKLMPVGAALIMLSGFWISEATFHDPHLPIVRSWG